MGNNIPAVHKHSFYSILTVTLLFLAFRPAVSANQVTDTCHDCDDLYPDNHDDLHVRFVAMLGLQQHENHVCTDHSFEAWKAAIAMRWAASMLNGQYNHTKDVTRSFIPGVNIGVDIINDCSIGSKAAYYTGQLMQDHTVGGDQRRRRCVGNGTEKAVPIVGMIGTSVSTTTTMVADVLRHHHVPLVGVSATVQELSNKSLYPMFIRAIPSDTQQAQTIVKLVKELKWSYVMGVYSDNKYGRLGMQEVARQAGVEGVCVTDTVQVTDDFLNVDNNIRDLVRGKLFHKQDDTEHGVLGVVFFGVYQHFMKILQHVHKNMNTLGEMFVHIHWILSDAVPLTDELKNLLARLKIQQKYPVVYLIGPAPVTLTSFTEYLLDDVLSAPPPWLSDQWRGSIKQALAYSYNCDDFNFTRDDVERCDLERKLEHSAYLAAAVDSVYILATLLKEAHMTLCGGIAGVCPSLLDTLHKGLLTHSSLQGMGRISYLDVGMAYAPYDFVNNNRRLENHNGDLKVIGQPLYSIKQQASDNTVNEIEHADASKELPSECQKDCTECYPLEDVPYVFKSGEVVLVGVFSLHTVSETDPFLCGEFRHTSLDFIAMEAFVNIIKNEHGANSGKEFGYLIIDDCYSPVRTAKLLVDAMSRSVQIVEKGTGKVFNPDNVYALIGANTSPSTMAILSQLKFLHRPVVSYAASIPSFNNRILYPYFLRTVPDDTVMAEAFVQILERIQVSYVAVITLDNIYGMELNRLFREKAEKEGICVRETFPMTVHTQQTDINEFLGRMKGHAVQVIILIVSSNMVPKVLESERVTDQQYKFHFISSETWDLNSQIISNGRGEYALGSFVVQPSQWVNVDVGLKEHISSLNVAEENCSVWLRKFWEGYFRCNLPGSFHNTYQTTCSTTTWRDENYEQFSNFTKTLRTSVATISVVNAIKTMMREHKTLFDQGVGTELAQALTRSITNTMIDGIKVFDREGNGNSPLDIYNLQRKNGGKIKDDYDYVKVGQFVNDGNLSLDQSKVKYYNRFGTVSGKLESSCVGQGCNVCGPRTPQPSTQTPAQTKPDSIDSSNDSDDVTGWVVGFVILLALLIGVVVLVILIRKGRCEFILKAKEKYSSVTSYGLGPALPPRPADCRPEDTGLGSNSSNTRNSYYTSVESSTSGGHSSSGSGGRVELSCDDTDKRNRGLKPQGGGEGGTLQWGSSGRLQGKDGTVKLSSADRSATFLSTSDDHVDPYSDGDREGQTLDDVGDNSADQSQTRQTDFGQTSLFPAPCQSDPGTESSFSSSKHLSPRLATAFPTTNHTPRTNMGFTDIGNDETGGSFHPPPRPHFPVKSKASQRYIQPTYSPIDYHHSSPTAPIQTQLAAGFVGVRPGVDFPQPVSGSLDHLHDIHPLVNTPTHGPPFLTNRAHSYPNGLPTPRNSVMGTVPQHSRKSVIPNGVVLSDDLLSDYNPPLVHPNHLPHRGYSNQGYVHSPQDELNRLTPQFARGPSRNIYQGMQPPVLMSSNSGPSSYRQQSPTTNVAYVVSSPPPLHTANPTPHYRTRSNDSDYLDPTDPPPFLENNNTNPKTTKSVISPHVASEQRDIQNVPTRENQNQNQSQQHSSDQLQQQQRQQQQTPAVKSNLAPPIPNGQATPDQQTTTPSSSSSTAIDNPPSTTSSSLDQYPDDPNTDQQTGQSIPLSITTTTTDMSEEDNLHQANHRTDPQHTPIPQSLTSPPSFITSSASLTSLPVSFGFQPHSKISMDNNTLISDASGRD